MTREETTRKYFEKDMFVQRMGVEIVTLDEEKAVVKAPITTDCLNANGCAQGGMLYTLADFAFAVLANHLHPMTVTQGGSIQYVRAAKTAYVVATAREITRSGRNTVSEVLIRDAEENVVCVCSFNGFIKEVDWDIWASL